MADLPVDSAGELAASLSGDGVTATVQTFPNTAISEDIGTNARLRTIEQTQAIPAKQTQVFDDGSTLTTNADGTFSSTNATEYAGVGAGRDDSAKPTSNSTQQLINTSFNGPIKPQPNVLDQYASYTYQLSWYLLTPDQVTGLSKNQLDPTQWQLLVQSGGAPTTTTTAAAENFSKNTTTGRNKYFSYDYYLDNLVIDAVLPLKGTHSANGNQSLEFKLVEPNGISLLNNLYNAIADLYKANNISSRGDYLTAAYCMGIRFFGYDAQGNLMQAANRQGNQQTSNITDPRSIVEKYYPFRLKSINFRLSNRAIEYTVQGNPIAYNIGFSSDRGTIPFAFNLSGQNLDELFNGKPPSASTATGDDGRKETSQQIMAPKLAGTDIPASIDTSNLGVSSSVPNNGWGEG